MVGLVAEYGHGLLTKVENQRVADLAAYAGALAYNTSNSTVDMTTAANNVAALNNIPSSAVTVTLVTSPSGDGQSAVDVQISTQVPLLLSEILGSGPQLPVTFDRLRRTGRRHARLRHRPEAGRHRRHPERRHQRHRGRLRGRVQQHGDRALRRHHRHQGGRL